MLNTDYKCHIIIGMFGSGKTEIALNSAVYLKEQYDNVAIADIDVISPYFRTRDEINLLENKGIKVITPPKQFMHADLPIIPPAVGGYIVNPEYQTIIDAGGNEDGSTVVGSLKNFLDQTKTATYFVVNTKRPFMNTVEDIIYYIERLGAKARRKVDFLISNSNLQNETTEEIILNGEEILGKVSEKTGIPIAFTAVPDYLKEIKTKYPKFILNRYLDKVYQL
ncbi:cobalamin biosynthesis protein CobQ [Marinitoga sp. 38H-ov]|uniref:cobalamin biosynthesis protein CobQ n=1 Tax=Marinitoga sp. 38H-ov TaxID=1755814 RepID=UPI0013EE1DEE|nr:cobalamin biosynthesis protein CobQ [Marinitoga sp. 38H-ov]KAF2956363.1 cobalamin biosynthesis protein CobQ [Marinitoga sp. 38H-ov]